MSLTKLLKAPIMLFRKDVITFLKIRRHDLGRLDDKLRYIAVKPTASISVLRRKVWHLLDLPDYCEEVIVLKTKEDMEIPLTELRKGNDPQHPFVLEVWIPGSKIQASSPAVRNMLTLGNGESYADGNVAAGAEATEQEVEITRATNLNATTARSNETMALNGFSFPESKCFNLLNSDYKRSEMSCRVSCTSLFKIPGRKNRDSFTNILLKIQSDLCTLSNKLSNLENRIPL